VSHRPAAVVVLAAGEGTRMKSATPKVLHPICGRSLVGHAVAAARAVDPEHLVVVVGHGRDQVIPHLAEIDPEAQPVVQEQQNGTGHAVRVALEAVGELTGSVLVTYGDVPLLSGDTLAGLLQTHESHGFSATVLTANVPDPTGYGRIVRDAEGEVAAIVEQKDAGEAQRAIAEINSGVYVFDGKLLRDALSRLTTDNAQGEEYLTDVLGILRTDGRHVGALVTRDYHEILGVNDRRQLADLRRLLNDRILDAWMRAGVTVVDPASTWVDVDVTLEPDTVIHPHTQLHGRTHIARDAEVGPNVTLRDTRVDEGARVIATYAVGAEIGPAATVGPYTYLRPGTKLGPRTKAGAYVEMKNAEVGPGSKVPHLSYVGDAVIGEQSNVGAATVFVNYDGQQKHQTIVGDHVRIGSDTMLVAPVTIGDGAYTAAGSVITDDVPPGAMGVGRARQRNVEGWVERRRAGSAAAAAAAAAKAKQAGAAQATASAQTGETSASAEVANPAEGGPAEENRDEETAQ
jgi:bifunctional UDP-N-acetylglucosamine pyrophosphorylase/glucosamine-1-phosphate N-acetyltransferase